MTSRFSTRSARSASAVAILICISVLAGAAVAPAGLASPVSARIARAGSHAAAGRLVPVNLRAAAARTAAADRRLVRSARSLHRCLLTHTADRSRCRSARDALERAGLRYGRAEARLAALATRTAGSAAATSALAARVNRRTAPKLVVSGETLRWRSVPKARDYILVRKIGSHANQFTVVNSAATAFTPPPVPGQSVRYTVRAGMLKSIWAAWVAIHYRPVPPSGQAPNSQTAPSLTASAQTLTWSAVANVTAYVLLTKVPGKTVQYSVVSGTSATPPAVPGTTATYSIRTAVEGSLWSPEVSISYPAPQPPETPGVTPPAEEPVGSAPELQTGINSGHEPTDYASVAHLGAKLVRVGFDIKDTASEIQPVVDKYASMGVRVLLLAEFGGRMPSAAEAQNLASWARAFGPGGTFWAARTDGSLAVHSIEFGNETDYSQQYHDEAGDASYRERGELYAVRVKEAGQAIKAAGSSVGLLVQADDTSGDWMNAMYSAVPDITQYISAWTMHSYGGREWNEYRFNQLKKQAAEHAASGVPIDVTEWGITTDNGRCLEYNDGLNHCMNFAEAAREVEATMAWMKAQLGSKLTMFIFYQIRDQAPTGTTTNWQAYFGAVGHEGQAKGPYTEALESVLHS